MSRDQHIDGQYLDLRARQQADKSFLGGLGLTTRIVVFFLFGMAAMAGFTVMYLDVDQRLSAAMSGWKDAQRLSISTVELNRAIDEVRLNDRHVRENTDIQSQQIHRRAVDQVVVALSAIQKNPRTQQLHDSLATVRDAFSSYGLEFSAMLDDRNLLGQSPDTGLRGQLRDASESLQKLIGGLDQPELMADFTQINGRGAQSPVLASPDERTAMRALYVGLIEKINATVDDLAVRTTLNGLLQSHSSVLNSLIEVRARLETAPQEIDGILGYVSPSLNEIGDYSEQLLRIAPVRYDRVYMEARQVLAGGSLLIVTSLVLIGLILMRSVSAPLARLGELAQRLVDGERTIGIPLQGNYDAIGEIARSLDKWLDSLAEIDHLKAQLDDAKMRLTLGQIAEAVEGSNGVIEAQNTDQKDAEPPLTTPIEESEEPAGQEEAAAAKPLPPEPFAEPAPLLDISRAMSEQDTIGAATRQLNQYNDIVTVAAKEVERTETLINLLSTTTQQIAGLEHCICSIRDEANLFVFDAITPSTTGDAEKPLMALPPDDGDAPQAADSKPQRQQNEVRRFEALRSKVGKAEEIVDSVHSSLNRVNEIAHEIASAASVEALEATNMLLSQSERLQTLLDDLITKVGPLSKKS